VYPGREGNGGEGKDRGKQGVPLMMKQPNSEVCRASLQQFMVTVHSEVTNCVIGAEWHAAQTEAISKDGCRAVAQSDNVLLPPCV